MHQHRECAVSAGEHTAIQCGEDPWLDRMEIDALDSLTPRKELSLYFVDRVSHVQLCLSYYNSLAQLQGFVLGDRPR